MEEKQQQKTQVSLSQQGKRCIVLLPVNFSPPLVAFQLPYTWNFLHEIGQVINEYYVFTSCNKIGQYLEDLHTQKTNFL